MDEIYVLDDGVIVEQGRYDDLIAAKGRFSTIFANQTSMDPVVPYQHQVSE
jgi:ATP-binding cassette subfamily B protein